MDQEPHYQDIHTEVQSGEWRRFFRMHPSIKKVLATVVISTVTSLVVIGGIGVFAWYKRDTIASLLIATLPEPQPREQAPLVALQETPEVSPSQEEVPQEQTDLSVTEVVAKVNPSVVSIEVSQQGTLFSKTVGKGSGFFVSSDGLIITNRHVVDVERATFTVTTTAGKKYTATLVDEDPIFDLAVLRVQGSHFPAVTIGNSDSLVLGQSVVAIGFALGKFENTVSVGIISGLGRSIVAGSGSDTEQLDRVIQTDAAINPGNSGGPLINLKGEVVGVNVAVAQGSQNIAFSIPAKHVSQVLTSIKAYGMIVRPYVGISYSPVTEAMQRAGATPVGYGVLVTSVLPDSPASLSGIQSGDIILSVDKVSLEGETGFATLIRGKRVGQSVSLLVLRGSVQTTVKVTLAQAPKN